MARLISIPLQLLSRFQRILDGVGVAPGFVSDDYHVLQASTAADY